MTCARPNATRATVVRAAIRGPRLRQGLGSLIDPGAVGVAATLLDESTTGTDLALAGSMRRALAVLVLADLRELTPGVVVADGGQWTWEGTTIAVTDESVPVPLRAREAILATVQVQPGLFGLSAAPDATSAEAVRHVLLGADQGMAGLRLLGVTWPELGEDL